MPVYPLAHLLLFGLVKDFWRFWAGEAQEPWKIPTEVKDAIKSRANDILLTSMCTKKYRCVLQYVVHWH